MNQDKNWKTIKLGLYSFMVDGKEIGTLEKIYKGAKEKAIFRIGDQTYALTYSGFWRSNYQITDQNGQIIIKSSFEKWFSATTNLEYNGKVYQLKIRNNPLAEFVIFDGTKELVSYGLGTNFGKVIVKINTAPNQTDYLLDFLLWYSFLPIAQENIGEYFTFQCLMMG